MAKSVSTKEASDIASHNGYYVNYEKRWELGSCPARYCLRQRLFPHLPCRLEFSEASFPGRPSNAAEQPRSNLLPSGRFLAGNFVLNVLFERMAVSSH
jgi:hypothetical protein